VSRQQRSPEYMERKRNRERERRRLAREALGFTSQAELHQFLASQSGKARAVKYDCGSRGMLTVAEIAQITGINQRTIRERIYAGKRGDALVKGRNAFGSHVIAPSTSAMSAMRETAAEGETVEQFMARGGHIQRIPGYTQTTYTGGVPARHYAAKGALGL